MKRVWKTVLMLALTLCLLPCAQIAKAETVSTSIDVRLTITGSRPATASRFTFVLLPDKADYPMPTYDTLTITGEGTGSFGPIYFSEPNTYTYKLYQVAGSVKGYTYDAQVYTVTLQVTSDANGKLSVTVYLKDGSGSKPGVASFANRYWLNTEVPKTGYGTDHAGA